MAIANLFVAKIYSCTSLNVKLFSSVVASGIPDDSFGTEGLWKIWYYSKTCLKRPLKIDENKGLDDKGWLNAGQKYCRMLSWSILQ